MIEKTVADRYSHALLSSADTPKLQDDFLEALEGLCRLQQEVPELKSLFLSPVIPSRAKKGMINKICEGKCDEKLIRFFSLLFEKKRYRYLPDITANYKARLQEKRGLMQVKLITAVPAKPQETNDLKTRLEASTGKKVIIKETVNPKIEGGGVLIMEGRVYDASVKTKLERLKNHLLSQHS